MCYYSEIGLSTCGLGLGLDLVVVASAIWPRLTSLLTVARDRLQKVQAE